MTLSTHPWLRRLLAAAGRVGQASRGTAKGGMAVRRSRVRAASSGAAARTGRAGRALALAALLGAAAACALPPGFAAAAAHAAAAAPAPADAAPAGPAAAPGAAVGAPAALSGAAAGSAAAAIPLQPLIDAAQPGGIVCLAAGTYAGPAIIAKPLRLAAAEGATVTIVTVGSSGSTPPALRIEAARAEVAGVAVIDDRGESETAAIVVQGNDNVIENVSILTANYGIQLRNADRSKLTNIEIQNSLALNSTAPVRVGDGAEVSSFFRNAQASSGALTNSLAASGSGSSPDDGNPPSAEPDSAPDEQRLVGNGIDLLDSNDTTITGSRIFDMQDGIYIENSDTARIADNRVYRSRYGYHLMFSNYVRLENNEGVRNVTGAMIMGTNNALVTGNRLTKQNENVNSQALLLYEARNSVIRGNTLEGNRIGIYMEQSAGNVITGNSLARNFIGVQAINTENNDLSGNDMISNVIQAEARNSKNNRLIGNYWDDFQGIDLTGRGTSALSYPINPFFLTLTERTPPFQLFFQAPGMLMLEQLFHHNTESWMTDEAPLLHPAVNRPGIAVPRSLSVLFLSIVLLLISITTIYYTGVRKK